MTSLQVKVATLNFSDHSRNSKQMVHLAKKVMRWLLSKREMMTISIVLVVMKSHLRKSMEKPMKKARKIRATMMTLNFRSRYPSSTSIKMVL